MKIPLGDLGNQLPGRQPGVSATYTGGEQIARAVENLGKAVPHKATAAKRKDAIDASNALYQATNHTYQLEALHQEIADKLGNGAMTREQAANWWGEQSSAIDSNTLANVAAPYQPRVQQAMELSKLRVSKQVSQTLQADEQRQLTKLFTQTMELMGKQAALPGADIGAINSKADALLGQARLAGIPDHEAGQIVQEFKDRNLANTTTPDTGD